ncbi:hypothetical protein [Massilia sp. ZL223]|uniref:hypothetical protein n=1 Tax=Massilia sp. ZL223 TaxID=2824904 RepID=UPI001B82DA46|nr:hypothetical protein [Massilia sp. ZL223]MBQ5963185.1 hypothetical protein [Massilia sp. ZL223]
MNQDLNRRKDDRHPSQPLQWDDRPDLLAMRAGVNEIQREVERAEGAGLTMLALPIETAKAACFYVAHLGERVGESVGAAAVAAPAEQASRPIDEMGLPELAEIFATAYEQGRPVTLLSGTCRVLYEAMTKPSAEQASKQVPTIDTPKFRQLLAELLDAAEAGEKANDPMLYKPARDRFIAHIDAQLAGQPAAPVAATEQAIPEGWKLVPVEPTPEMIAAMQFSGDIDIAIGHAQFYMDAEKDYAAMLAAAPAAPLATPADAGAGLTPLDYRAQGREEALQIILGQDPEDPFSDCVGSSANADAGDYSSHWKEDELRKLLHIGDRKHDAYDRAEAMYWQARGELDEAKRMMSMAERAPYLMRLEKFLCSAGTQEAWDLLADLKREANSRLSTPAAPVTAYLAAELEPATLVYKASDIGQSGAPVTAEPEAWILQARSPEGDPWQNVTPEQYSAANAAGYETRMVPASPQLAAAHAAKPADEKCAARWRFMMRIADNEEGPEFQAMQEVAGDGDDFKEGIPKSVQLEEMADAAMKIVAAAHAAHDQKGGGNG